MTSTKDVTIIRVRRNDGTVDEVEKGGTLSDHMIAKIKAATLAAGRGEVIDVIFRAVPCEITITDADRATMRSEAVERVMTLDGSTC